MGNPLDIEYAFQRLVRTLQYPLTPRSKFLDILGFLNSLPKPFELYTSHIIEAYQLLPEIISRADFSGIDPERIERDLDLLLVMRTDVGRLDVVDGLDEALERLRGKIAAQYEHVSEPKGARGLGANVAGSGEQDRRPLVRETRAQSVLVPVLERTFGSASAEGDLAGLRRISLRFTSTTTEERDVLHTDVTMMEHGSETQEPHRVPLTAARRLFQQTHGNRTVPFFEGNVSFDEQYAMHAGGSANLGIAAAAYCGFLDFMNNREIFRLRTDAAFTGDITEMGEVLPVEENSLARKIEAVFFSQARTLALARSQVDVAHRALSRLVDRYPNRRFQIVGMGHLEEVFFDRRLADHRHIGILQHYGRKVRGNAASVTLGFLLLMACAFLVWRFAQPLSPDPVVAEFAGDTMILKNSIGQAVDELPVGVFTVQRHLSGGPLDGTNRLLELADITDDGYKDDLYVQYGNNFLEGADTIICYDSINKKRLWTKPLVDELSFPDKPEVIDTRYRVVDLKVGRRATGGVEYVIVVANHYVFFPSIVMTIDPTTGATLQKYVHIGQMGAAGLADVNGDGTMEVICGGTNNAFKMASVMALDPEHLNGHSPTTGDYYPEGIPRGWELFYVLIPRSMVGLAFPNPGGANGVADVVLQRAEKRFVLSIQDVGAHDSTGRPIQALLEYYFGFDGRPIALGTSSPYDKLAIQLHSAGRIDRLPDKAYFEEYQGSFLRWDEREKGFRSEYSSTEVTTRPR